MQSASGVRPLTIAGLGVDYAYCGLGKGRRGKIEAYAGAVTGNGELQTGVTGTGEVVCHDHALELIVHPYLLVFLQPVAAGELVEPASG